MAHTNADVPENRVRARGLLRTGATRDEAVGEADRVGCLAGARGIFDYLAGHKNRDPDGAFLVDDLDGDGPGRVAEETAHFAILAAMLGERQTAEGLFKTLNGGVFINWNPRREVALGILAHLLDDDATARRIFSMHKGEACNEKLGLYVSESAGIGILGAMLGEQKFAAGVYAYLDSRARLRNGRYQWHSSRKMQQLYEKADGPRTSTQASAAMGILACMIGENGKALETIGKIDSVIGKKFRGVMYYSDDDYGDRISYNEWDRCTLSATIEMGILMAVVAGQRAAKAHAVAAGIQESNGAEGEIKTKGLKEALRIIDRLRSEIGAGANA